MPTPAFFIGTYAETYPAYPGVVAPAAPGFVGSGVNSIDIDSSENLQRVSLTDRTLYHLTNTNPDQQAGGDPRWNPDLQVARVGWRAITPGNVFKSMGTAGQSQTQVLHNSNSDFDSRYLAPLRASGLLANSLFMAEDTVNTFNTYYDPNPSTSAQDLAEAMFADISGLRSRLLAGGYAKWRGSTGTSINTPDAAKNARYVDTMDLLAPMLVAAFPGECLDTWRGDVWLGKGGHARTGGSQMFRDQYHLTPVGSLRYAWKKLYPAAAALGQTIVPDLTSVSAMASGAAITLATDSLQALVHNLRNTSTNALLLAEPQPSPFFAAVPPGTWLPVAALAFNPAVSVSGTTPFTVSGSALEPETQAYQNQVLAAGGVIDNLALVNAFIKAEKQQGVFGSLKRIANGSFARIVAPGGNGTGANALLALSGAAGNVVTCAIPAGLGPGQYDPAGDAGRSTVRAANYESTFSAPLTGEFTQLLRFKTAVAGGQYGGVIQWRDGSGNPLFSLGQHPFAGELFIRDAGGAEQRVAYNSDFITVIIRANASGGTADFGGGVVRSFAGVSGLATLTNGNVKTVNGASEDSYLTLDLFHNAALTAPQIAALLAVFNL